MVSIFIRVMNRWVWKSVRSFRNMIRNSPVELHFYQKHIRSDPSSNQNHLLEQKIFLADRLITLDSKQKLFSFKKIFLRNFYLCIFWTMHEQWCSACRKKLRQHFLSSHFEFLCRCEINNFLCKKYFQILL